MHVYNNVMRMCMTWSDSVIYNAHANHACILGLLGHSTGQCQYDFYCEINKYPSSKH